MTEIKTREPSVNLRRRKVMNPDEFLQNRIESILTESNYTSIQFIDINKLRSFKNQQRSYFDDDKIKTLADTIKEHGIRQPLTVIQSEDDPTFFEIVSGERRFLAAKKVGLEKVPCIIIHNMDAAEEISIIENVQRVDLHPIELGKAYIGLLEKGIVSSNTELAAKIGVPRTQVSEYVQFASFPESIASDLIANDIKSRRVLRRLAKCQNMEEMEKIVLNALGVKTQPKKQLVLKFFICNENVEAKFCKDFNLSKHELIKLREQILAALELVDSEINK